MKTPELVTATQAELDEILALARAAFPARQYQLLEAILGTFTFVMQALQNARTSLKRFRKMLFGARTESKANVLGELAADDDVGAAIGAADVAAVSDAVVVAESPSTKAASEAASDIVPAKPRRGHGRNGAQAYSGAAVVEVALTTPVSGQVCPECEIGRVYAWPPRTIVKVTGQTPIGGTVYRLQQRRCRACDALFTAPMPAGVAVGPKHDERCVCMLILLRYVAAEDVLPRACPCRPPRSACVVMTAHNFASSLGYRRFMKSITDDLGWRCCDGPGKPVTSTLANALAFISRSTSA
jgi:hypothetical protein